MRYHKIVLAGGNGYLGSVLSDHFKGLADEVILLSRQPKLPLGNIKTVVWDGMNTGSWIADLENADLLVNLCGKNVNCRYTEKNKKEIIRSRVVPTLLLEKAIAEMQQPPKLWINVTSATIYRHAEDHGQDENTGEIGSGFSIDVCRQWEQAFFATDMAHTRKIALRMGIVFGHRDGVFPRLLNLAKLGLGGKQGNGEQYVSWIHEQDVARITEWLMHQKGISGIINCASPQAVTNKEQMRLIRQVYGIKIGAPAPAWLLAIGALLIGTETELILKSRWVVPKRLTDAGYVFTYPAIREAIEACKNGAPFMTSTPPSSASAQ